jgi:hypothetical protein
MSTETATRVPGWPPASDYELPTRSVNRTRRRLTYGSAVVVVLLAAGALLGLRGLGGAAVHTVKGTYVLFDADTAFNGCHGVGDYSDIDSGVDVVLKDEHGTVVATDALSSGTAMSGRCAYHFAFTGVPDATFYQFEVGTGRGTLHYTRSEMDRSGWQIKASLGAPVSVPPFSS